MVISSSGDDHASDFKTDTLAQRGGGKRCQLERCFSIKFVLHTYLIKVPSTPCIRVYRVTVGVGCICFRVSIYRAGGRGVAGANADNDAALEDLRLVMEDKHQSIREGKSVINKAEADRQYMENQNHEVTFDMMTRLYSPGNTQIALILAPESDTSGRAFCIKLGAGHDDVSPPLYIAQVTAVNNPTDGDVEKQTIDWLYYTPALWTNKTLGSIAEKMCQNAGAFILDRNFGAQPGQVFHSSEMVLVWEVGAGDGRTLGSLQYQQAQRVLRARRRAIQQEDGDKVEAQRKVEEAIANEAAATKAAQQNKRKARN